jgi:deoxyribodipyrimidine photo-lyase
VPELAGLPDRMIHQPWNALPLVLHQAGIVLGETYPEPMVDHKIAKDKALAAFASIKKARENLAGAN